MTTYYVVSKEKDLHLRGFRAGKRVKDSQPTGTEDYILKPRSHRLFVYHLAVNEDEIVGHNLVKDIPASRVTLGDVFMPVGNVGDPEDPSCPWD